MRDHAAVLVVAELIVFASAFELMGSVRLGMLGSIVPLEIVYFGSFFWIRLF